MLEHCDDDNIKESLYRLFDQAGVKIPQENTDEQIYALVEPFEYVPMSRLIDAFTFHLSEIIHNCEVISAEMETLISAGSESGDSDDSICMLWGCMEDQRFHVFQCPPLIHRMREELFKTHSVNDGRFLTPSSRRAPRNEAIDSRVLARIIFSRTSLSLEEVEVFVQDIEEYLSASEYCVDCINRFVLDSDNSLPNISIAFCDLASAILGLGIVLLRADAAITCIMYNENDE